MNTYVVKDKICKSLIRVEYEDYFYEEDSFLRDTELQDLIDDDNRERARSLKREIGL